MYTGIKSYETWTNLAHAEWGEGYYIVNPTLLTRWKRLLMIKQNWPLRIKTVPGSALVAQNFKFLGIDQ